MKKDSRRLLEWYERNKRSLPWRNQKDAYRIWVSEIMLQQTRVETVLNYYERFLDRFPSVESLAAAGPDEVRAAWSGLGYYRRARFMLEAAKAVVSEHAGEFPNTLLGLRALPGFGRYTAGAVASIAFDLPAPAVDGNAARVITRWRGIREDPSRGEGERVVWAEAERLAKAGPAAEITQALIELGATVCLPRNPSCTRCPWRSSCVAHRDQLISLIPAKKKRAPKKTVELTALVVLDERDRVLLLEQPDSGLFGGLYTPPLLEGHLSPRRSRSTARNELGLELGELAPGGQLRHILTHRELELHLFRTRLVGPAPAGLRPVSLGRLHELGIPTITSRVLEQALPEAMIEGLVLPSRRSAALATRRRSS